MSVILPLALAGISRCPSLAFSFELANKLLVFNHLTTNDDYSCHRNLAACYQLHFEDRFCASKKGGMRRGGWVSPGDSAWRLLQLAVKKLWSMPGAIVLLSCTNRPRNTHFTL